MDKESLLLRLPIVYTTKLDEMKIFKKDMSKIAPEDIIQSIISESKPIFKGIGPIDNRKMCKNTYDEDIHANSSPIVIINSNNSDTNGALVVKSEIETDTCSRNKVESLLAMCKPLKIVLEDINKIVPKRKVKDEIEVLNISSDSDNDVITIGEEKIIGKPDAKKKSVASTDINIITPVTNHIIKDVSDLRKVLLTKELQNCCIIIYNMNFKELDAYQIGENYNVTRYKTRKYTEVYKLQMKKCKFVVNIIACCWNNRQSYVPFLLLWKKYINIAKVISSNHPCKLNCTCCCDSFGQRSAKTQRDNEAVKSDTNISDSLINNSPTSCKGKSKLITTALTFEPKKKLKWYHNETCSSNDKVKINRCCKRLLKFNNTQGEVDLYELGPENVVYSKVTRSTDDESSWLFKTVNRGRYLTDLTFTGTAERDKKIQTYRRINNNLSFRTKCFLGNPMKMEVKKKSTNSSHSSQGNRYVIEHTKTLMSSKRSQVLSIVSEVRKVNYHTPPEYVPPAESSPVRSPSRPKTPQTPPPLVPAGMDQEEAQKIHCLIKEILHRFRDVSLTINSEGKVSAALNAPLTSLTPSEVKILSQILNHAQSQVDTLGLTPGTCLRALVEQAPSENSNSSTNATNLEPSNDSKNEESAMNESTENNFLNNSSSLIASKKNVYKQSFCNYLGVTLDATPKINNVFSLNNGNRSSSDFVLSPLKGNNLMIEINNGLITNNLYANNPDVPITLDKESQTIPNRPNKRKTSGEYKDTLPKIRIRTATEILVENSSPMSLCDSAPTPIADHNYLFRNESKTLPSPEVPLTGAAFEVHANTAIIEHPMSIP